MPQVTTDPLIEYIHSNYYSDMDAGELEKALQDDDTYNKAIEIYYNDHPDYSDIPLDEFTEKYKQKYRSTTQDADQPQQDQKVRDIRPVAKQNEDGTESTVKLESGGPDGRFAYPTLFPDDPNDPKEWTELSGQEAYEEAKKRGELFQFGTSEQANKFAEGSWKKQPRYSVNGQQITRQELIDSIITQGFMESVIAGDTTITIEEDDTL